MAAAAGEAYGQCPGGQTEVTMNIVTDRYGEETTWSVTGPGGSPVFGSGGPYTQQAAAGEYPMPPVSFCVPDGTVMTVNVNDSYGDGMCCAYGEGSWTLSVGGTDVSGGGSFATAQSATVALGTDLGVTDLGLGNVIAQGNTTVSGTVTNMGITSISSFTVDYSVDGGSPQSQTFNTTIAPGASYEFSHSTSWNATVGSHTLVLAISGVTNDMVAANDSWSGPVNVATQSVTRTTLIEQFTSSTCVPCANFNVNFAPLLTSLNTNNNSNVSCVKYHMNWPAPGNDPSYNPDGNSRKSYYGVTGIPDLYLDGHPMTQGSEEEIMDAQAVPAFVSVDAQAIMDGTYLTVQVDVTPYANFTGTHKLHIAVLEYAYDYAASTTVQDEFHHVQRKMMPNASGSTLTTLTAGETQSFAPGYSFIVGGPAQGNYNLWTDMENLRVVAFVQNTTTKEVLQADIATISVGMDELAGDMAMGLYPNPTNGQVTVNFEMPEHGSANFQVFNMQGELVHSASVNAAPGVQRANLDLQGLADGLYHVDLVVGEARSSRKVLLSK
jgi:hypothetical protein